MVQHLLMFAMFAITHQAVATPLHKAAGVGDLIRVRNLLQQNISPNAKIEGGWSVLHKAATMRPSSVMPGEVMTALLEAGGDPNAKSDREF